MPIAPATFDFTSTALGALIGALLSHSVGNVFTKRSEKRSAQQKMVSEVCLCANDFLTYVMEVFAARTANTDGKQLNTSSAFSVQLELTRYRFRFHESELRLRDLFRNSEIVGNFVRLSQRCNKVGELFAKSDIPSLDVLNVAMDWIGDQIDVVVNSMASKAGLHLDTSNRICFARSVSEYHDKRMVTKLSKEFAPWEFGIQFDIFSGQLLPEAEEKIRLHVLKKVGTLRCTEHHRPAHITIYGPNSSNLTMRSETCCEGFNNFVKTKLGTKVG